MHSTRLITTVLVALLLATPAVAQDSETTPRKGPNSAGVSAWGILGYGNGFGIGGRYMMPLVPEGFLKHDQIKDQLALEFGVDLVHYSYSFLIDDYGFMQILPVVGAMWNVWLNDQFALYPKLDLGYGVGFFTGWNDAWGNRPTHGGFFWQTSVGLIYKTSSVAVRLELGNGLLKGGVGIGF